jgi:hypothetical protein
MEFRQTVRHQGTHFCRRDQKFVRQSTSVLERSVQRGNARRHSLSRQQQACQRFLQETQERDADEHRPEGGAILIDGEPARMAFKNPEAAAPQTFLFPIKCRAAPAMKREAEENGGRL